MLQSACFCFFHSLNDFLSKENKNKPVTYKFTGSPAIKDSIEAIGIPHTEVDVILVKGTAVDFHYPLNNTDEVEVYPFTENPKFPGGYSISPPYSYPVAFVTDVHLGKLAKTLRMLGIDTCYQNNYSDQAIASIAKSENRIVLTRDVGLLKQKNIRWGYWLRSQKPEEQTEEVIKKFNLENSIRPFARCLECNGTIEPVSKEAVLESLPPKTIQYFNEYYQCACCKKVYWKGSHYERMQKMIENFTT